MNSLDATDLASIDDESPEDKADVAKAKLVRDPLDRAIDLGMRATRGRQRGVEVRRQHLLRDVRVVPEGRGAGSEWLGRLLELRQLVERDRAAAGDQARKFEGHVCS